MKKEKICVVDDDPGFLTAFTKALLTACPNASVTSYTSGTEFLNAMASFELYQYPNLIILDLKMPVLNGMEVLSHLRQTPQYKALPVVILTQSDQPVDVNQAYENGVNAYLLKPDTYQELKELARNLCIYWVQIGQLPLAVYRKFQL